MGVTNILSTEIGASMKLRSQVTKQHTKDPTLSTKGKVLFFEPGMSVHYPLFKLILLEINEPAGSKKHIKGFKPLQAHRRF